MSKTVNEILDYYSITKDIQERKQILSDYFTRGIIDRNKAIDKIRELQRTDAEVTAATTTAQILCGSVNLECADNNTLIENLQFQISILEGKLITKTIKNAMEDK